MGGKRDLGGGFPAVKGDEEYIVMRYSRERSRKLTLWLRSRGTGDRNVQGIDGECADGEEDESGFGEHGDRECCEEEQMTMTPGLKFGR